MRALILPLVSRPRVRVPGSRIKLNNYHCNWAPGWCHQHHCHHQQHFVIIRAPMEQKGLPHTHVGSETDVTFDQCHPGEVWSFEIIININTIWIWSVFLWWWCWYLSASRLGSTLIPLIKMSPRSRFPSPRCLWWWFDDRYVFGDDGNKKAIFSLTNRR